MANDKPIFKVSDLAKGVGEEIVILEAKPATGTKEKRVDGKYVVYQWILYNISHKGTDKVWFPSKGQTTKLTGLKLEDNTIIIVTRTEGKTSDGRTYDDCDVSKKGDEGPRVKAIPSQAKEQYQSSTSNQDGMRWGCALHVASRNHAGKEVDPRVIIAEARVYYDADPEAPEKTPGQGPLKAIDKVVDTFDKTTATEKVDIDKLFF